MIEEEKRGQNRAPSRKAERSNEAQSATISCLNADHGFVSLVRRTSSWTTRYGLEGTATGSDRLGRA